ncbi:JmjC domain, hydroxylase [Ceratobasidium sp. AG-Ba]|nr:JmjC domain, hydroxylase [Ceratobasidium sp. AG-Ba]
MVGKTGLFRQQNEERRHTYSVRDWAALCAKDGLRAPPPTEVIQAELNARRSRRARKGEDTAEDEQERKVLADFVAAKPRTTETKAPIPKDDEDFYDSLEPTADWLPPGTSAADYTPAVCRALERHYWRNCGLGKDPMYGADMQGSLFDEHMTTWNVSCLPSVLSRLLPDGNRIPGVNTPYLYFGMWRATFAWHVEDMDLYSINYIHWGAPKYWYAIPSIRAYAFEQVMSKHFPTEANECPQFMRHKSFLASPAILAEADCRPNTLVQHQGEFVITYPRGYHAGFNVGFNCAESVNFALESWIEIGRRAQYCKCVGDSVHLDVDAILEHKRRREDEDYDPLDVIDGEDFSQLSFTRKRQPPPMEYPKSKKPNSSSCPPSRSKFRPRCYPRFRQPLNRDPNRTRMVLAFDRLARRFPDSNSHLSWAYHAACARRPIMLAFFRQAHESCAQAIPETWVVESPEGKYVRGVEAIVKDRWALPMVPKSKTPDADFVVTNDSSDLDLSAGELLEGETVVKQRVTVLCPQHNPRVVEARKLDKQQKLDADIGALTQYSRIKVRASGGVFAVTLVNVYEDRRTVEVIWDQGGTKEFRYTSVVWSDQPDGAVQEKPTEVATNRSAAERSQAGVAVHTPASQYGASTSTHASHHAQHKTGVLYSFQGYSHNMYPPPGYAYPGQLRLSESSSSSISTPAASVHEVDSHASTPASYRPSQPPPSSYTIPVPIAVQYPYPYSCYDQQGYPSQPQFFPAHGYYPPITTFHPAVPSASVEVESEQAASSTSTITPVASLPRHAMPSYVGVRPASSQDILNRLHPARCTPPASASAVS